MDMSTEFGPAWGTLAASMLVAAVAVVGAMAPTHTWWAIVSSIALSAAFALHAALRHGSRMLAIFRAACCLTGGGWVAWCWTFGVRDWGTWVAWGVGTLIAGLLAVIFGHHERAELAWEVLTQQAVTQQAMATERERPEVVWAERIKRNVGRKVDVTGVQPWPGVGAHHGYTVSARLPEGKMTLTNVSNAREEMEVDADLPPGCGIEVLPGATRRQFRLDVSVRDAMAGEGRPYPMDDIRPRSLLRDPITIGWQRDTSVAEIGGGVLRADTGLISGAPGSGKSNIIHVATAGLVQCVDTLVFMIDTSKSGNLAIPWVTAFAEHRTEVPAVDWVAWDWAEARLMTDFVVQLLKERALAYQQLKRQVDDDKLPISAEVPQIIIIIDEVAEMLGVDRRPEDGRVVSNLMEIHRTGREFGVRLLPCALRATADTIPSSIKVHTGVRIGMKVHSPDEAHFLFGWESGPISIHDMPHEGCGILRVGANPRRVFRGWRMVPSLVDTLAVATAGWRPRLDEPSLNVPLGGAYQDRWTRALPVLFPQRYTATGQATGQRPVQVDTPLQSPTGQHLPAVQSAGTLTDTLASLQRVRLILAAGQAQAEQQEKPGADRDLEREFAGIVQWDPDDREGVGGTTTAGPRPDARTRMMDILGAAGPGGMQGKEVAAQLVRDGYEVPLSTLYRWLGQVATKIGPECWVHPDHRSPRQEGAA